MDVENNTHDNFVYLLKDPNSDIPFYVGVSKGNKNRRLKEHLREAKLPLKKQTNTRKCKKINEIINNNSSSPEYIILKSNLNRIEAYSLEKNLIQKYGRKNIDKNGILTNIDPGNDTYNEKNSICIYSNTPSNSGRGGLSNACCGWDDWIERRKVADEKWRQTESAKRKESDIKNNNMSLSTNLPYSGIPLEKLIEDEMITDQHINIEGDNIKNDTGDDFVSTGCGCFLIIILFILLSIIFNSCYSTYSAQQEYESHKIKMITPVTKPISNESLKIEKDEWNIIETPKLQSPSIIESTPAINTTNNIQSSREIYEPIYKKIEEKPKKSQTQINIENWEKRKKQIDDIYRR